MFGKNKKIQFEFIVLIVLTCNYYYEYIYYPNKKNWIYIVYYLLRKNVSYIYNLSLFC